MYVYAYVTFSIFATAKICRATNLLVDFPNFPICTLITFFIESSFSMMTYRISQALFISLKLRVKREMPDLKFYDTRPRLVITVFVKNFIRVNPQSLRKHLFQSLVNLKTCSVHSKRILVTLICEVTRSFCKVIKYLCFFIP